VDEAGRRRPACQLRLLHASPPPPPPPHPARAPLGARASRARCCRGRMLEGSRSSPGAALLPVPRAPHQRRLHAAAQGRGVPAAAPGHARGGLHRALPAPGARHQAYHLPSLLPAVRLRRS
jgi:hypothetical protein